jgi:hypothetical protein
MYLKSNSDAGLANVECVYDDLLKEDKADICNVLLYSIFALVDCEEKNDKLARRKEETWKGSI